VGTVTDNSLINLGDLSKPATVLIEKISDAVGGIFKPYQIVRVAKAEAEAGRIQAESQINITDLHRRAMHRFLEEEAKKQSNMESITQDALPLLGKESKPENVKDDWITNFFDKSRIVSDEDMQKLWARVLAGEANAPGAFSKRTVNLLADLDKADAELFTRLCGFSWMIGFLAPLLLDLQQDLYRKHGIDFSGLSHLESLGLLQFNTITGFQLEKLPKQLTFLYFGRPANLTLPAESNNDLPIGSAVFTRAGQQLAMVSGAAPVEGFYDFVCNTWATQGLVIRS
jgi:hypothetical protein